MHLHSKAEELVKETKEQMNKTKDKDRKQAYEDVLPHIEYIATRLKEIGSK